MKKVGIIGGGVAGLSTGIYALQAGFEATIYEKNDKVGGECITWERKGFHIDNCIHWLTGTKEETKLYKIWENLGVLGKGISVRQPNLFYAVEYNGQKGVLWKDLEKTEKELVAVAPEDEGEIRKLMAHVKLVETMEMPTDKPMEKMNPIEIFKLGLSMKDMAQVMKEYGKITIGQLAERFKHPLLQALIRDYMPEDFLAYAFIVSYATFTSGNGGVPEGGSYKMIERMRTRFESLGGKIYTKSPVTKIEITQNKKARGFMLQDGKAVEVDYIVCSCDTSYTFGHLLDQSYMEKKLRKAYGDRKSYPVNSAFQVALGVEGEFEEVEEGLVFSCIPLQIGKQKIDRMGIKNYRNYGAYIAPKGKTVLQSHFLQCEEDYEYWEELYKDRTNYQAKKEGLGAEVLKRIEMRFPAYKGRLEVIDIWTPITYRRYCNAYKGAYMSFITTSNSKQNSYKMCIKGLDNVILASQWLLSPGGLPTAAVMGKFALWLIEEKERKINK